MLPLGIDTHDTESERFLYFPSVFFLLFFTLIIGDLFSKRLWIPVILIVIEGAALRSSYNSFVKSSIVSQTTLSALTQIKRADTLFCRQLPEQYRGAFIFRNGFISALKLVKKDSVHQVIILSRSELFHPNENYGLTVKDSLPDQNKRNGYLNWTEDGVSVIR